MKQIFTLLMVLATVSQHAAYAQRAATSVIQNVAIANNTYSFDIMSRRVNPGTGGANTVLVGTSSFYLNYNGSALAAPALTNINPRFTGPAAHTGDYDPMTVQLLAGKIAVTITFTGNLTGVGATLDTTGPAGERICTLNLSVTNPAATSQLGWDSVNSALTDSRGVPVMNTFVGRSDTTLSGQAVNLCQWVIPLRVSDGVSADTLRFGIHPQCSNGYDNGHDRYAPPAPPSGGFDCRLRFPAPPAASEDYKTDIRSNQQVSDTFYVYYAPGAGGGPITLSWNPVALDSLARDFIITDNFTGALYTLDMRTVGLLNTGSSPFLPSSLRIIIFPPFTPIQLAYFTAVRMSDWTVYMSWRTVSEINNYGFEVQRRRDAEPDFTTLPGSFIAGYGTTNIPHDYEYTDTTVSSGIWWYRLKQIDLDGSTHYFDPVRVDMVAGTAVVAEKPATFQLHQNFPNPFNPTTTIRYDLPTASRVKFVLYNLIGQEVATLIDGWEDAGFKSVQLHAGNLASGIYVYRLEAGEYTAIRKLMLLR